MAPLSLPFLLPLLLLLFLKFVDLRTLDYVPDRFLRQLSRCAAKLRFQAVDRPLSSLHEGAVWCGEAIQDFT
jgi:hypothetical protein